MIGSRAVVGLKYPPLANGAFGQYSDQYTGRYLGHPKSPIWFDNIRFKAFLA
jgi:hypothetical protein